MFNHEAEVRAFSLGDLPLIQRLKSRGISLDSESYLSRGLHTLSDATLSRLPLGDLGAPTVVVRRAREQGVGQLRHTPDAPDAHIVFMAPSLPQDATRQQESTWLALLDGLSRMAGRRGALNIHAEVDENSAMFEALRQAGFASYARQDIWRRDPAALPPVHDSGGMRPARPEDLPAIRYLYAQTVPKLAQPANPVPAHEGLLYTCGGELHAFIAISAGNRGVFLRPFIKEDDAAQAPALLTAALWLTERATTLPVYCCVRQYQTWLNGALDALGFEPWARQTVMVKHTTARIARPDFAELPAMQSGVIHNGRPGSVSPR
ncbi:MAG: hypothetical protein JXN59_05230 [Anaerolineae bacterium]|nr:hypothetical protein [Anaerolineae bacterium]